MSGAIKLNRDATHAVLQRAIHTQAQVVLQSERFTAMTINGRLTGGDNDQLQMQVTGKPGIDPSQLVRIEVDGLIYSDQRYRMTATIIDVISRNGMLSLWLSRPGILHIVDRRRFLRANLAPSSTIQLDWSGSTGPQFHDAQLLNISADGVACRLEAPAGESLQRKAPLKVHFGIPNSDEILCLPAHVTNKTATNDGYFILGLQFDASKEHAKTIQALRVAIESGAMVGAGSEVQV